ncbi:MAG: LysR substrate-binding domain-containing protein [Geminicoccaceae bacterium]
MQSVLGEVRNTATGHLRVNTTVGIGTVWLVSHLREFRERYPEITVTLAATDSELDLSMREADVAIRLQQPTQSDLVQRRLMTVHTHIYASVDYIAKRGAPTTPGELSMHDLIAYGDDWQPPVPSLNWIRSRDGCDERINRIIGRPRSRSTMSTACCGRPRAGSASPRFRIISGRRVRSPACGFRTSKARHSPPISSIPVRPAFVTAGRGIPRFPPRKGRGPPGLVGEFLRCNTFGEARPGCACDHARSLKVLEIYRFFGSLKDVLARR